MHWEPGQTINFQGGEWIVKMIDNRDGKVTLTRQGPASHFYADFGKPQVSFHSHYEEMDVTVEELYREQIEQEARGITAKFVIRDEASGPIEKGAQVLRNMSDFKKLFGSGPFMDEATRTRLMEDMVKAWGQPPPKPPDTDEERKKIEQEMFDNLQQLGVEGRKDGAMAALVKNLSEQMAKMAQAAKPATSEMKTWQEIYEANFPGVEHPNCRSDIVEEQAIQASRQAKLDAEFAEPEGDGFFVFWNTGKPPRLPGVNIFIDGIANIGGWDRYGKDNVHKCDTLEDAWAFVDYLKDDEAGEAICIREDAVVLFHRENSGWEALTKQEVPDEYMDA